MKVENILELPIFTYAQARSAWFASEYYFLNAVALLLPGAFKTKEFVDVKTVTLIQKEIRDLLKRDSQNIAKNVYPISVLYPESPVSHALRIPAIIADGLKIYRKRKTGRTTIFDKEAKEFLSDLPKYYQRNFHFQTNGYLSPKSAELYEHQVEMLFGGAADAMRRLIIKPLREKFGSTDGRGLKFLEVGAGTGRATRFIHLAFPKAKIVALDLSEPYLKVAQKKLEGFPHINFMQGDAANLPFQNKEFDAVYSVFLYHELPRSEREAVLKESKRVLKTNGFFGFVDSIQQGENKDFDILLKNFPKDFHEPFYRDYSENPMEDLMKKAKFKRLKTDYGFFSKACWSY